MPKYLFEVKYTLDGLKGLKDEGGTARAAAAKTLIEDLGGSLESFHFAFGGTDAYVVADLPDNASSAAVGLTVGASGGINNKTTVLITPEEMDAAAKKQPSYRPPGS